MSSNNFFALNCPVSVSSILLNIFFVFCMISPQKGTERLKQPLDTLLGSLVGCNIAAHICIFMMVIMVFMDNFDLIILSWSIPPIAIYTMMISVNSSHWLNVFYCLQIVNVQHSYFIWIKRNLRVFIYCALIINIAVCLLGMSVNIGFVSLIIGKANLTDLTSYSISFQAVSLIRLSLFVFSLFGMLGSSCVTVVFLWRHIKNMEKSSGSSSSFSHQRQIKVTIRSISVQALLHITCSSLVIVNEIMHFVSISFFDFENNMLCTVISLYSIGTAINLGMSQSVFRQRAVHVWQNFPSPFLSKLCLELQVLIEAKLTSEV